MASGTQHISISTDGSSRRGRSRRRRSRRSRSMVSSFSRPRGRGLRRSLNSGLPLTGFPERKLVRLKYTETITLDPGAGAAVVNYFSCNGMFDPNITGTGHQPLGYDQWQALYESYQVLSAKIKVTPVNASTANVIPVAYGVILDDNSVFSYVGTDEVIESKQGQDYKLAGHSSMIPQTNYSKNITKIFSGKKFFGSGKNFLGENNYQGTDSTNPANQAFFGVWAGSIGGANGGNMSFIVEIEYIALFTEPVFLDQS